MRNITDYRPIRNFSIIAHVDHGKSTLADRIIELTNFKEKEGRLDRILDSLDLEKQRGITIKLNAVSLKYFDNHKKQKYTFNLIDTPGHADFSYEVSRSLAACEGVVLLVDATKGIQAQTLAYFRIARDLNLKFLPVVNKIDLPSSQIEKTVDQLAQLVGCKDDEVHLVSSKTGRNIPGLLDSIVRNIPGPRATEKEGLKGLVFDLLYDKYNGVVAYTRIFEGSLFLGQKIKLFHSKKIFQIEKLGIKTPENISRKKIDTGEIC